MQNRKGDCQHCVAFKHSVLSHPCSHLKPFFIKNGLEFMFFANFSFDLAVNQAKNPSFCIAFGATCAGGSVPRTPIWGLYLVCHDSICATPMSSQNETQASSKNDWSQA